MQNTEMFQTRADSISSAKLSAVLVQCEPPWYNITEVMQVEQLATVGQGSRDTTGAMSSMWRKKFPCMVPSVSQEHTLYKT